jgi:hypothetical protein
MMLHKGEFMQGLRHLKYPGSIDRLWNLIDRDTTGNVSFVEFAPEAALDLALFKKWTMQSFGSAKDLFKALDEDHSGSITLKEFAHACNALGLPDDLKETVKTLFILLDTDGGSGKGSISQEELSFLDKWSPPPYFWEAPDYTARKKFEEALMHRHNENMLMAWRRALDKDNSMRVSYEEFVIQCKSLAKRGLPEASPASGITALYIALDEDRSGWFTLRDWDPETFERLAKFWRWCRKEFGNVAKFARAAENVEVDFAVHDDKGGITYDKFTRIIRPLEFAYVERVQLFEALQATTKRSEGKHGRLFQVDLGFLDKWDPDREIKEDNLWAAMVNSREKKGAAAAAQQAQSSDTAA